MKRKVLQLRIRAGVVEVEQLPTDVRLVVKDYDVSGEEANLRDDEGGTHALSVYGDGGHQVVLSVRGGCADVQSARADILVRIVDET